MKTSIYVVKVVIAGQDNVNDHFQLIYMCADEKYNSRDK